MFLGNYETQTTFWTDFTIADQFGADAIRDTFNRAFEEWKTHTAYLTELVMVLNWKMWEHYEKKHEALSRLYQSLWEKADAWAWDNLKGNDLNYYMGTTD